MIAVSAIQHKFSCIHIKCIASGFILFFDLPFLSTQATLLTSLLCVNQCFYLFLFYLLSKIKIKRIKLKKDESRNIKIFKWTLKRSSTA